MPEANLANTKLRLSTVLSKKVFFLNNLYDKSKVSIVLINHKVKS